MTSKNFMGTCNNPPETLAEFIQRLESLPNKLYGRAQLEKGEEGTIHIQWCVGFSKVTRVTAIRRALPGSHVEMARNAMRAWTYCGKEDTRIEGPLEYGVPPAAKNVRGDTKKRNAMIIEYGVVKAIDEGLVPVEKAKSLKQSLEMYQLMKQTCPKHVELDNEYHYGVSGAGKSHYVRTSFPNAFIKSNDIWWDGYDGQEVVIIEEFGPKQIGAHHLKQWLDHYPFKAAVKGGYMIIRPVKFLLTSNYPIGECYEDKHDLDAIKRRIKVTHYTQPYKGVLGSQGVAGAGSEL